MLDVSSVLHSATALRARGSVDRMPSRWRKARLIELAQRGGEVGLGPLGHLLERRLVLRVKGDGERRVE